VRLMLLLASPDVSLDFTPREASVLQLVAE
jgi:hypothetical protein